MTLKVRSEGEGGVVGHGSFGVVFEATVQVRAQSRRVATWERTGHERMKNVLLSRVSLRLTRLRLYPALHRKPANALQ